MKTLIFAFASLLLTAVAIPLTIAAIAPNLSPYAAEFPGERTFDNPGGPIPATVAAFEPFKNRLGLSWDDDFLYIESNGLPDHDMMRGITAWQQQVPLPHAYVGDNRFALPLNPTVLEEPQELTLLGPIAIAVNGIPIFHALTQSGKDAYLGGELDEWGGHCGRADDYHYHIAPSHLEEIAGKGNPIAFGLDGHPVYLEDPANDKPLDECHGYFDDEGIYRYIGNLENPYMMAYFRGAADLEDRPRAQGVRPFLQPLRGAEITGFSGTLAEGYSLEYKVRGETHQINYEVTDTGADFEFFDPAGNAMKESYQRQANNGGKGSDRPPGGKKGKGGQRGKSKPGAPGKEEIRPAADNGPRQAWLAVHAAELDANEDGVVDYQGELMQEARRVFLAYDVDKSGDITPVESQSAGGIKSPLGGFVKQHASELDKDRSGSISAEELAAQFRKFFQRGDLNGDQRLSKDEVERMKSGKAKPAEADKTRRNPPDNDGTNNTPSAPATSPTQVPTPLPDRPNFVLFLIDDMGWNAMGFTGNQIIETPRTDEMARQGMIFTNAYASAPNCAPTRACLMSGQYPPRHGVYTVVDDRHTPGSPHHKVLAAQSNAELATESVTIAEALKSGGYATGMFGMWNLGRGRDGPTTPTGQGFDIFKQPRDVGFDKDRFFNDEGQYLTDELTTAGIEWMSDQKNQPFFLYMAYHAVHSPFEPKPELVEKYRKKGAQDPDYAATVDATDSNVGRVIDALRDQGQANNTIVIFHSDNGGTRRYIEPLAGGKGTLYEGGIRVPTAIWGPGVKQGMTSEPMLSMDIYPTLLDLAGLKPHADHPLDGESLAPLLSGASTRLDRDRVFWHFPSYIGGGGPSSAMRMGDWKVIEQFETQSFEIYDLSTDPGETRNLAEAAPGQAKTLLEALHNWQSSTGAPRTTVPNPNFDPSAEPKRGRDQRGNKNDKPPIRRTPQSF